MRNRKNEIYKKSQPISKPDNLPLIAYLVVFFIFLLSAKKSLAQIIPDQTLPVNSQVTPGCTICQINDGTVRLVVISLCTICQPSACQTAKGDKRAPLGLAGIAVKSGARSTIASLWSVDDESTYKFMVEFYHQLSKSKVTKAEAVRLAQLKILKEPRFENPYYWSPFVLLGNWL